MGDVHHDFIKPHFSVGDVLSILSYDAPNGAFYWLHTCRSKIAGTRAGYVTKNGYRVISVFGQKNIRAHRLVWFIEHGEWPPEYIDHKNGERDDNRIENLRSCSFHENAQNRAKYSKKSASKLIGARYHKAINRWVSSIVAGGEVHHLGCFNNAKEAHDAYVAAKARLHRFSPALRDERVHAILSEGLK